MLKITYINPKYIRKVEPISPSKKTSDKNPEDKNNQQFKEKKDSKKGFDIKI